MIGQEILRLKNEFKIREGFNHRTLQIPKRILQTPTPLGNLSEDMLRKGVELYLTKALTTTRTQP